MIKNIILINNNFLILFYFIIINSSNINNLRFLFNIKKTKNKKKFY